MTEKRIDSRIIHKHDSQINWAANDSFIPKQGEIIIYDSDVDLPYSCMKVGDGQTSVEGLPFILPEPVINEALDSKADKSDLDNYLTKKDYIAGESGGLIDLSNFLTRNEADNLYASANIIELVYPVGSFYLSINDVNPQILFRFGAWQRIEGKFLFGADTAHALGTTGGEETHTLTIDEMPEHSHTYLRHQFSRDDSSDETGINVYGANNKSLPQVLDATNATGGGVAHNNMPPYLSICIWQRVA